YGHTSHGSQITSGIDNLQNHIGEPYTFNPTGSGGALSYQEQTGVDLGHNGDTSWTQVTRQVLNVPGTDRNVVMWSWCGGVSDNTEEGINIYLNKMTELENDYPDVKFIYMTGHLDIWAYTNLKARNQQIRDHCQANNKILFDFADIESYNPDLEFFDYANDNCNYYSGPSGSQLGNWADEWCGANPGSDLCWSCSCAHSKSLNCNLKGRAFWWMMARMAGWEGAVGIQGNHRQVCDMRCWYSNGCVCVSLKLTGQSGISIQLFDTMGKEIGEANGTYLPGYQRFEILVTNLKHGLYLIMITINDQIQLTGKCLIIK
ncbi:MAG: hypothetical protein HQ542_14355, partial [Bacteroidia bacterium]|nr:hypothetical protein [Bacteroidia bacterium]